MCLRLNLSASLIHSFLTYKTRRLRWSLTVFNILLLLFLSWEINMDKQFIWFQTKLKNKLTVYYLTPVRTAITKKSTNSKYCRGCGEKGTLLHCWWQCKLTQPLWRTARRFLKKTRNTSTIWPSNPYWAYAPRKLLFKKTMYDIPQCLLQKPLFECYPYQQIILISKSLLNHNINLLPTLNSSYSRSKPRKCPLYTNFLLFKVVVIPLPSFLKIKQSKCFIIS